MNASPAEVLRQSHQEIIKLWETEVRNQIPAARSETRASLRNSIPDFIIDLCHALETDFSTEAENFLQFAHKHGRERANGPEYSLEDAITEYNILRRVIFHFLEDKCQMNSRERDIIYEAISLALAKAGAEFARTQIREVSNLNTKLLVALEAADLGMISYDLRSDLVEWTDRIAEIFGLSPESLILPYKDLEEMFHPEDRDHINQALRRAVAEDVLFKERFRIVRKNGEMRWIQSAGKTIRDDKGRATHITGTILDITESKLSRDTINRLAERLQLITDIQPTLVLYFDANFNYRFVNQTSQEWFLRKPSSIIGKNLRDMFSPEDYEIMSSKMKEALQGRTVRFKEYINYPAGRKYVDFTYKPHFDESGKTIGVFASVNDRTEERATIDLLEKEQVLRDKFVSTLSHDLRTPLTASKMSAQIIARKISDPQIQTHTTRIVDNINRADKLIQDLLDAGKIRAGKLILPETEDFDLVELISVTLEDLTTIHGDRFRLHSPPKLVVNMHAEGIRRILENLCTNAIKYGSTKDPVKIKISLRDQRVLLSVCNTGNPLIHVDKEKLFEPFEQAHTPGHKKSGWGIGLTIVKGLTEAHGGTVQVESDHETIFTVILPLDARPFLTSHLH